jgi:hypothetical protein
MEVVNACKHRASLEKNATKNTPKKHKMSDTVEDIDEDSEDEEPLLHAEKVLLGVALVLCYVFLLICSFL